MNIIVLATEISTRHWLGRLLNEAGLCVERNRDCEIEFVNSMNEVVAAANNHRLRRCVTIICSSAISGMDLMRIPDFLNRIVVISPPGTDEQLLCHSNGTQISEQDLTASRLKMIIDMVPA